MRGLLCFDVKLQTRPLTLTLSPQGRGDKTKLHLQQTALFITAARQLMVKQELFGVDQSPNQILKLFLVSLLCVDRVASGIE